MFVVEFSGHIILGERSELCSEAGKQCALDISVPARATPGHSIIKVGSELVHTPRGEEPCLSIASEALFAVKASRIFPDSPFMPHWHYVAPDDIDRLRQPAAAQPLRMNLPDKPQLGKAFKPISPSIIVI